MKRLLYVDIVRGLMIVWVIILHAVGSLVFRYDAGAANQVGMNPVLFLVLLPVGIVATWAPFFIVLSGTAHAYSMFGNMRKAALSGDNGRVWSNYLGALTNSGIIYVYSLFNVLFLHHSMEFNGVFQHTMLTSALHDGVLYPPSVQLLFYSDALAAIAIGTAAVNTVLFLLWRYGGVDSPRRDYAMLFAMMMLFVFTARDLHTRFDHVYYQAITDGAYVKAAVLKSIIGANQSPVPNVGYGFLGALFGLALVRGEGLRRIQGFGVMLAAFFLLMAGAQLWREGLTPQELLAHTLPMKLHHLNLGLITLVCLWLITWMEFAPEERRAVIARRTTLPRRFSMAALSVFLLEGVTAVLLSRLIGLAWPGFQQNPVAIVLFVGGLILLWDRVLRLWERVDFKYGFEWYLIKIVGRVRGRCSQRLNAAEVLHHPTPIAPTAPVR